MTAQFLLRFDDLCPGMNEDRWARFLPMLERHQIHPILAVVPDNRDPELGYTATTNGTDSQCADFWAAMRHLHGSGSSIALHGYQHLCRSEGRSMIPLHRRSEFAGADESQQRAWIKSGIQLLRGHGLTPELWVAPRHGFDLTTIRTLASENIGIISDGFAVNPFLWHGAIWLPQQLWAPVQKRSGLWTICIHPATASEGQILDLESFLSRNSHQFTSVDRVMKEWLIQDRSIKDKLFHVQTILRNRASRLKRELNARFQASLPETTRF